MANASQLRSKVEELMNRSVELDEFEDWFLANNWNAHLDSGSEVIRAVHRIEGALLDYSSEAIDEKTLRSQLANAVQALVETPASLAS